MTVSKARDRQKCIKSTEGDYETEVMETHVVSRPVANMILTKMGGRARTGKRVHQAPTTRWRWARLLMLDLVWTPAFWVEGRRKEEATR